MLYIMILFTSFRDVRGLQYMLADKLEHLEDARDSLLPQIKQLESVSSPELISQTVECCLRPGGLPRQNK